MTSLPFEDLPEKVDPDRFAEFYNTYPLKVKRPRTQRAYLKALKAASHDDIMEGLHLYIQYKPDYCDWAHPSTWLNDCRWQDELNHPLRRQPGTPSKPDPDLAWQHKAAMAKTSWGRHKVPRQDIEECHRRGLLTDEEKAEALR